VAKSTALNTNAFAMNRIGIRVALMRHLLGVFPGFCPR
jgi:hypothetical protein